MATPFDNLDKAFDIESEPVSIEPVKEEKITKSDQTDQEKDYSYVRAKFYSLLENAEEVIQEAMETALQSGHPRAFEVVLKGIRDTSDLGDKLMDLHKKMKDLDKENVTINQTNIQNNLAMTTEEMIKMLKSTKTEDK